MKYLLILGDGMADRPIASLQGKTPLEAALTPNIDRVAAAGELGLTRTLIPGYPYGSDVANMTILGYDPTQYYSGRAPFEAAGNGVALAPTDLAMRINLVSLLDGRMNHYASGHISDAEATALIDTLAPLNDARFTIHPGRSYRHLLVWHGGPDGLKLTPPHDITGQTVAPFLPDGPQSERLRDLIDRAAAIFADHPVNAARRARGDMPVTTIWPWGEGRKPDLPTFRSRFGIEGAVISAVDLIFGLAADAGLARIDVPGATGYIDTNYRGKADAALRALEHVDFVFLHVEAPDEASHEGNLAAKLAAIEAIDREIVGPVLAGLTYPVRLLILPDHATPLETKTHADDPIPYCLAELTGPPPASAGVKYGERAAAGTGLVHPTGHTLINKLFER